MQYLVLRIIRHFIPEGLARFLLRKRWIIQPGLESDDPQAAADSYVEVLNSRGSHIGDRRILVFGYGGRFAIGVELLKRGATHVVLCDHVRSLDHERNLELLPQHENYLGKEYGEVKPNPEFITLLHGDIREKEIRNQIPPADIVVSNSVYEHLDDVAGITRALAGLTRPDGVHLHFADLRDHYFKYPFEMLTFSDRIWKNLLNPSSNLNRFRMMDYKRVFEDAFHKVDIQVLSRLESEFEAARSRIRPEFLSGNTAVDAVGLIRIFAECPGR